MDDVQRSKLAGNLYALQLTYGTDALAEVLRDLVDTEAFTVKLRGTSIWSVRILFFNSNRERRRALRGIAAIMRETGTAVSAVKYPGYRLLLTLCAPAETIERVHTVIATLAQSSLETRFGRNGALTKTQIL